MSGRRKWLGLAAVAVAVPLALAGCSSGNDGNASSGAAGSADLGVPAPAPADKGSAPSGSGSADSSAGGSADSLRLEPALVRTAKIDVVVDDVAGQAGRAAAYATAAGGAVAGDNRSGTGSSASAVLVLKVPPARMDGLLEQVGKLGTERERSSSTEDVTADVADIGSRVATMRASIARVRAILARADKIGDVVAVEGELSKRTTELESLEARQRALAGQTSYATVTVGLYARSAAAAPPPADRGGFVGGLQSGWRGFTATVSAILTVLGAVLPFLLLAVPLGLAARWALRRRTPTASAPAPPLG